MTARSGFDDQFSLECHPEGTEGSFKTAVIFFEIGIHASFARLNGRTGQHDSSIGL